VIQAESGKVYLVGAGPGDPDLLTLRAANLLAQAGVILHDDLVPQSILDMAGKQALVISVGKRCGRKKITQAAIHDLMIVSARKGQVVIRLKSGDPMIFGRAGEEIEALRQASVPFEVVPGVTAASSAAAFLETSLTDRRISSRLIVMSGHHAARTEAQPELWPGKLPTDATLAIYMPGHDLAQVASALRNSGLPASTPCVAVIDASRPDADYRASQLCNVAALPASSAPALLLVGQVFEALLGEKAMPASSLQSESENERFTPTIAT
jgi:uroporphyrin-III C-methyltransferase